MARADDEARAMPGDLAVGLAKDEVLTSLSLVKSTVSTTDARFSLSPPLLSTGVCTCLDVSLPPVVSWLTCRC